MSHFQRFPSSMIFFLRTHTHTLTVTQRLDSNDSSLSPLFLPAPIGVMLTSPLPSSPPPLPSGTYSTHNHKIHYNPTPPTFTVLYWIIHHLWQFGLHNFAAVHKHVDSRHTKVDPNACVSVHMCICQFSLHEKPHGSFGSTQHVKEQLHCMATSFPPHNVGLSPHSHALLLLIMLWLNRALAPTSVCVSKYT